MSDKFQYAIFPLELINDQKYSMLSANEKILYTLILNRLNCSKRNLKHFSDSNGIFVYYSNREIQQHLGCGANTAYKALLSLEKSGLINRESQNKGLPSKIYVNDIRWRKSGTGHSPSVSFDTDKAQQKSKENRNAFGEKKNKRRTRL